MLPCFYGMALPFLALCMNTCTVVTTSSNYVPRFPSLSLSLLQDSRRVSYGLRQRGAVWRSVNRSCKLEQVKIGIFSAAIVAGDSHLCLSANPCASHKKYDMYESVLFQSCGAIQHPMSVQDRFQPRQDRVKFDSLHEGGAWYHVGEDTCVHWMVSVNSYHPEERSGTLHYTSVLSYILCYSRDFPRIFCSGTQRSRPTLSITVRPWA